MVFRPTLSLYWAVHVCEVDIQQIVFSDVIWEVHCFFLLLLIGTGAFYYLFKVALKHQSWSHKHLNNQNQFFSKIWLFVLYCWKDNLGLCLKSFPSSNSFSVWNALYLEPSTFLSTLTSPYAPIEKPSDSHILWPPCFKDVTFRSCAALLWLS